METYICHRKNSDNIVFDRPVAAATDMNYWISDIGTISTWKVPGNYATVELNRWKLDKSYKVARPSTKTTLWSNLTSSFSGADGRYDFPYVIKVTLKLAAAHKIPVIHFYFGGDSYPNNMNVKLLNGDYVITSDDAAPTGNEYICSTTEAQIDKIIISFYSMNKPNRYLRVDNIILGEYSIYNDDMVVSIDITEEVSLLGDELPANTLDLQLRTPSDFKYSTLDEITVVYDGINFGSFYIDNADKQTETLYNITAYNWVYLLGLIDVSNIDLPVLGATVGSYIESLFSPGFITIANREADTGFELDISVGGFYDIPAFAPHTTVRDALKLSLSALSGILTPDNMGRLIVSFIIPSYDIEEEIEKNPVIEIRSNQIFDDVSVNRTTTKTTLWSRSKLLTGNGDMLILKRLLNGDVRVGKVITLTSYDIIAPESIKFYYDTYQRGEFLGTGIPGVDDEYFTILDQTLYSVTFRINKTKKTIFSDDRADYFIYYSSTHEGTRANLLVQYEEKNDVFSGTKFIDMAWNPYAILHCRAADYYKDDVEVTATIVMDTDEAFGKQPQIRCGKWVKFDTDAAKDIICLVNRVEYSLRGGQKLIGKVTAHTYG